MQRKFNTLPFIIFALFYFFINYYIISALKNSLVNAYLEPVFWFFSTTALFLTALSIWRFRTRGSDLFFVIATHFFLAFFVGELIFGLFIFIGDAYQFLSYLVHKVFSPNTINFHRSNYWLGFSGFIFFTIVILFIYGIVKGKYAYRIIKHTLFFEDLPVAFDGFTITQISDVHAGSFTKKHEVQKGIDLINAQKSDLFVFTGDLVNNEAKEIEPYINQFAQITAPYGKFSVLGNHDYGDYIKWPSEMAKTSNLNQLKINHQKLGFKLLLDEHVTLIKNEEKIILVGIENWGLGFGERGDLNKALQNTNTNDFKILLSHDPSHWEAQVKNNPTKIQLTLAGHTHGMQFGVEAFGFKWSPVKYRYKHWAGIKEENNRYLNINRGFGFLGFSGRIGIWPEITVIELKKKQ